MDIDFDAAENGGASREPVSYYVVEYSADGTDWQTVDDLYYIVGTDMVSAGTEARIPGTYDFGQKGYAFGRLENPGQGEAVCTYITTRNPQNLRYRVRAVYASTNSLISKETAKTAVPVSNGTSDVVDVAGSDGNLFKVYPTYASSTVTIESASALGGTISIYSMGGALAAQTQGQGANTQAIDISPLPTGAYILRVQDKTAYFFKR